MNSNEIQSLASDMAYIIARWEFMIDNDVIPKSYSYILDEIYQQVTKYLKPMEVCLLVRTHKQNIGGYKNA